MVERPVGPLGFGRPPRGVANREGRRPTSWAAACLIRAFVAVTVLAGGASATLGQQTDTTPSAFPRATFSVERFGWDAFLYAALQMGLQPVQQHPREALRTAGETVVVLAGHISLRPEDTLPLIDFLQAGGRVLIATDRGGNVSSTWGYLSRLVVGPVQVSPEQGYMGFADCPILTVEQFAEGHPLVAGVQRLVTNRPGYLVTTGRGAELVVRFPRGAYTDRELTSRDGLVATIELGDGRAAWVADHSIFLNEMLNHGDNARFMFNLLAWLTDGGGRQRLILVHDGRVVSSLNFGGPVIPPIPLDKLAQDLPIPSAETLRAMANDAIIDLEDDDVLNSMLRDRPHNMRRSELRRILLSSLVFFLIVVFVMQLFVTGRPVAPPRRAGARWFVQRAGAGADEIGRDAANRADVSDRARVGAAVDADVDAESGAARLLRGGTVARTAQTLAQQCLLGLSSPTVRESGWLPDVAPRIELRQSFLGRWATHRAIRRVWQIATGRIAPMRHPRQLRALAAQLAELRQLHESGQLRLKWD